MNFEQMTKLLGEGEGFTIEYKEDTNAIGSNTYETVCSFSNRYGGYILLGVDDDGTVLGVNRNSASDMKKNFINILNNPNMISPTMYLTLEEFEYEGKLILYVNVPIGSLVERCKRKVFDRNGEADVDISSSTMLVAEMYARKSAMFTERKVFPYATKEHLRF
jgi:ATP-dependent DNA helicase RecG